VYKRQEECVAAIAQVPQLDRRACRDHVQANFSVQRMTDGYEQVYRQLVGDLQSDSYGNCPSLSPTIFSLPQPKLAG